MPYAFHFDAAACSGCKACQVACRDRNRLADGVRWRRVYEVAGGGWTRAGDAWVNDVVAYNVSVACNHCESPACVPVCPTGAMHARPDGVVLIDPARCMGCRYCEWACPYGAPQYDAAAGAMTKCDLCIADVEAGGTPACVAACPLRALELVPAEPLAARGATGAAMHPLPEPSLTRPRLSVAPHARAPRPGAEPSTLPRVANAEEVLPAATSRPLCEPALAAFTLMLQAAAGMTWAVAIGGSAGLDPGARILPLLAAAALALGGAVAAALHLGRPVRAWMALGGLRTSWLSREVAAALLFTAGIAATVAADRTGGAVTAAALAFTAAAGLAMVLAMSAVYRLPAVPAWDTPLTTASFLLTALYLGTLLTLLCVELAALRGVAVAMTPRLLLAAIAAAAFGAALLLVPRWRAHWRSIADHVDPGLFDPLGVRASASSPGVLHTAAGGLIFLVIAAIAGRPSDDLARDPGPGFIVVIGAALVLAIPAAVAARSTFYGTFARRGL